MEESPGVKHRKILEENIDGWVKTFSSLQKQYVNPALTIKSSFSSHLACTVPLPTTSVESPIISTRNHIIKIQGSHLRTHTHTHTHAFLMLSCA